ncbi:MAG: hypothetical protein Q8P55_02500 [bacterium]|nr:hypothetical protein [bacterium]
MRKLFTLCIVQQEGQVLLGMKKRGFGKGRWNGFGGKVKGEPIETEEMRPHWFSESEIPYTEMWPDDKHWLPLFLEGKILQGKFSFGDNDILLNHTLEELDSLPRVRNP